MAIDPRHMMGLLAIAEEGSFTRAATRLNLSQPALSAAIGILEDKVGMKVLDRTFRGAETNEYGAILVRRAIELRAVMEAAELEVRERAAGRAGPLVFGATPGMFLKVLPEMLSALKARHPQLSLEVIEGWDDTLDPLLVAGEIDFYFGSITSIDGLPEGVVEDHLYRDAVAVGVGPGSPWLERESVSIAELVDEHWVAPRSGAHLRHIQSLFSAAGVPWPKLTTRTNSLMLTEELVVRTGAVTIVSSVQVHRPEPHSMRSVPLVEGGAKRVVIRRRATSRPSAVVQDALACLREVVGPRLETAA